jgi:hypothetical protein
MTMTRNTGERPATSRGELTPGRGPRRLWPAIDARRRLNARPTDGIRTKADSLKRDDPGSPDATTIGRRQPGQASPQSGGNEGDLNRAIIRHAKGARDRAAQSLRLARMSAKL